MTQHGGYRAGSRGKCPHCSSPNRFERASIQLPVPGAPQSDIESFPITDIDKKHHYRLRLSCCTECAKLVLVLFEQKGKAPPDPGWKENLVWPVHIERPVPEEVPENIADDYREAVAVLGISPKASAALSRRCLQTVLREKGGADEYTLSSQIKQVLDQLPSNIAGQLDYVKIVGDFGAHEQKDTKSGEILDVEAGEAEYNLDVLDALFEHYYVGPAKSKRSIQEIREKAKAAGKTLPDLEDNEVPAEDDT